MNLRNNFSIIEGLRNSLPVREQDELKPEEKEKIQVKFKEIFAKEKDAKKAASMTADELSKEIGAAKVISFLGTESKEVHDAMIWENSKLFAKYDSDTDTFFLKESVSEYLIGSDKKAVKKFTRSFIEKLMKTPDEWVLLEQDDDMEMVSKEDTESNYNQNMEFSKDVFNRINTYLSTAFPDDVVVTVSAEMIRPEEHGVSASKDQFIYNTNVSLRDDRTGKTAKFMISLDFLEDEVAFTDFTVDYGKVTRVEQPTERTGTGEKKTFRVMQALKRVLDKYKRYGILAEEYLSVQGKIFEVTEDFEIAVRKLYNNKNEDMFLDNDTLMMEKIEKGSTIQMLSNDPDDLSFKINEEMGFRIDMFDNYRLKFAGIKNE